MNHRHATRSWEVELPRGLRELGEKAEDTAIRETKEETGYHVKELKKLGEISTDSGLSSAVIPVFFAKVSTSDPIMQDDSEAIHTHVFLSKKEAKQALIDGFVTIEEKGKQINIPLRDAALAYAIVLAEQYDLL